MKAQVKICSYSAAERSQDRSCCIPFRMSTCTASSSAVWVRMLAPAAWHVPLDSSPALS